ncbi:MAG: Do family serine endopeptidase [Candidatus Omnitrophota bacterium]|jgi:serine protease Do
MKRKAIFFVAVLLAGFTLGVILTVKLNIFSTADTQEEIGAPAGSFMMEDTIVNVAKSVGPSVVSISTEHMQKMGGGIKRYYFGSPFGEGQEGSPFGDNDPFRQFFNDFFGELPEREFRQRGLGSGVIINSDGYILTNQHVIDNADKITVTLSDGRNFKGVVKGQDPRSDLAVIQIDARNLPAAKLGDSDSSKIGQWVVAIGNPFAFAMQNPEPTVTVGVISALHRSLGRAFGRDRDYNDLIQTDAAINPGNSGGPLVNIRGEVIGINVAIFSTSGGHQGIGFAIPVSNAKKVISKLIEGKKVTYGWFGVTVQELDEGLAEYFGLPDKNGVLVVSVLEDGPAKKAGIKDSDIIRSFDNKPINSVRELLNAVGQAEVGRKVKVVVVRDKKQLTLQVEIGERPDNLDGVSIVEQESETPESKWRGLSVEELTPEIAGRLGVQEKTGVVVMDVEPGSPSDEAGVVPGDVIVQINKEPVNNKSDYRKVTSVLKSDALVKLSRGYVLIKTKVEK